LGNLVVYSPPHIFENKPLSSLRFHEVYKAMINVKLTGSKLPFYFRFLPLAEKPEVG